MNNFKYLFSESNRIKEEIRTLVLPDTVIKCGIWMPSEKASCFMCAKKHDRINDDTIAYFVENNNAVFQKMKTNIGIRENYIFQNKNLHNVQINHFFDYAFFDFCGSITRKDAGWMNNVFQNKILPNATVAITHMFSNRNNKFLLEQDKFLRSKSGALLREKYGVVHVEIQRIIMLIHNIFSKWTFDLQVPKDTYKHSVSSMLIFKMSNFIFTGE